MYNISGVLRGIVAVGVIMSYAAAQGAATTQSSGVPALKAGQTLRLLQRQTVVKPQEKESVTIVTEVLADVSVVSAGADGAVVRWKRGPMKIVDMDSPDLRQNPDRKPLVMKMVAEQFGPLVTTFDNVTMELAFDRDMQYSGLRNYEDVKAAANRMMDGVEKWRVGRGLPPTEANIRAAVMNRNFFEYGLTKEAVLYFAWMTVPVARGGTAEREVSIPSLLGGDPTPGTMKAELAAEPDPQHRLLLRTTSQMDVEKFVKSLRAVLERTPGAKPLEPDAEQQLRGTSIGAAAEYHIDPAGGLATFVIYKTTASVGGRTQSEEFRWSVAPTEH